jgi:ABC-type transport system substrate-binding protein
MRPEKQKIKKKENVEMKNKASFLTIIMVLVMILTSCAQASTPTAEPTAQTSAETMPEPTAILAEAIIKEPKILRIAFDQQPPHLDVSTITPYVVGWAADPLNDYLVTYDNVGENIIPSLAEEYEFLSDTEFRFKLREAYFHNGKQVTAADVAFSLERIKDSALGSAYAKDMSYIDHIEQVSDTEGIVYFTQPFAPLLDRLTWIPIYPEGSDNDSLKTSPVGAGPFKLVEWATDQYIHYVKFNEYWDADRVSLDEIYIRFFSDYNSAKTAFLAGETDILYWATGADIPAFQSSSDYYVFNAPNGSFYIQGVVTKPPYNDPNVMKAIKYAIDKETAVATILSGNGEPSVIALKKQSVFYDPSWEYSYDLDKAKEYMAASAYPDGFDCKLIAPNTPTEGALAEFVAANLKEIGINCEVNKMEISAFLELFNVRNYELGICGFSIPSDPDYPMWNTLHTGSSRSGYSNAEVDSLLDIARTTFDIETRKTSYSKAFQIAIDDAPTNFIFNEFRSAILRNNVQGLLMWPARYKFAYITIEE